MTVQRVVQTSSKAKSKTRKMKMRRMGLFIALRSFAL